MCGENRSFGGLFSWHYLFSRRRAALAVAFGCDGCTGRSPGRFSWLLPYLFCRFMGNDSLQYDGRYSACIWRFKTPLIRIGHLRGGKYCRGPASCGRFSSGRWRSCCSDSAFTDCKCGSDVVSSYEGGFSGRGDFAREDESLQGAYGNDDPKRFSARAAVNAVSDCQFDCTGKR